mmetsp:Transcript_5938/g.20128  ORF Transcript_5938/g.20128 Transcript_5938/m.20128 type:complete len:239 (-) Transcript_5938:253-969(-)
MSVCLCLCVWVRVSASSPLEVFVREELVREGVVVRVQFGRVEPLRGLGVEVVLVELFDPRERRAVTFVEQSPVPVFSVERVEGVEPHDVERFEREGAAGIDEHLVHVLVVAPAHVHAVEPAASGVDAKLSVVARVGGVGVGGKGGVVHDGFVEADADGEGVANHGPLRRRAEARVCEHLAEIVNERGEVQPILVRIRRADRLRRLHRMLDLRQVKIGVRVVHNLAAQLHSLPYCQDWP